MFLPFLANLCLMSFTNLDVPAGRRERVYDDEERKHIDPYKTEYLNAKSAAGRRTIVQNKILPDIFEYWAKIGQEVPKEAMASRSAVNSHLFFVWIALM